MFVPIAIALLAAFASALLMGAVASGAWVGALLVYLAPLPLLILGFGWHPWLAALGAVSAGLGLSLALGGPIALVYTALIGLPAYLLSLAPHVFRAADIRGVIGPSVGHLVLVASLYAALVTLVGALAVGPSFESLQALLTQTAEQLLRAQLGLNPGDPMVAPGGQDLAPLVQFYVTAAPIVLTATLAIIYLLNAYIAARVSRGSGRLMLPWPEIAALRLPRWALLSLVAGFVLSSLPGFVGLGSVLVATGLAIAFIWQGFAVLHFITRGKPWRGPVLWLVWFLSIFLGFPALVLLGLALADAGFGLRKRSAAFLQPPNP